MTVQRTAASERCGLMGNYWLKAENDVLILKDPKTKKNVLVWPYKLLRRYGRDRVGSCAHMGRETEGSDKKRSTSFTPDECRRRKSGSV